MRLPQGMVESSRSMAAQTGSATSSLHASAYFLIHPTEFLANRQFSAPVVATTGEPSGKEASTPPANDVRQPNDSKPPNGHAGGVESEGSTRSVSNDTIEATSTGQSHESSPSTRSPRRLVLTGPTEKMSTPPKPMPASESQGEQAGARTPCEANWLLEECAQSPPLPPSLLATVCIQ